MSISTHFEIGSRKMVMEPLDLVPRGSDLGEWSGY